MEKALQDYPKLQAYTEIDKLLTTIPKGRFGVIIPEEQATQALQPIILGIKNKTYTPTQLDYIEQMAPKDSLSVLGKAFAESEGIVQQVPKEPKKLTPKVEKKVPVKKPVEKTVETPKLPVKTEPTPKETVKPVVKTERNIELPPEIKENLENNAMSQYGNSFEKTSKKQARELVMK